MALENDRYTYRVTWSEEDNEYVGLCAEFPSLSWLAANPEAALRHRRFSPGLPDHLAGKFRRADRGGQIGRFGAEHPQPRLRARNRGHIRLPVPAPDR